MKTFDFYLSLTQVQSYSVKVYYFCFFIKHREQQKCQHSLICLCEFTAIVCMSNADILQYTTYGNIARCLHFISSFYRWMEVSGSAPLKCQKRVHCLSWRMDKIVMFLFIHHMASTTRFSVSTRHPQAHMYMFYNIATCNLTFIP